MTTLTKAEEQVLTAIATEDDDAVLANYFHDRDWRQVIDSLIQQDMIWVDEDEFEIREFGLTEDGETYGEYFGLFTEPEQPGLLRRALRSLFGT